MVKHLTCRRAISAAYTRGWVEQAFRRLVVRASLIHGEANGPFLLRPDVKLLGSGRQNSAHSRVEGPAHSIRVKVEQECELG